MVPLRRLERCVCCLIITPFDITAVAFAKKGRVVYNKAGASETRCWTCQRDTAAPRSGASGSMD